MSRRPAVSNSVRFVTELWSSDSRLRENGSGNDLRFCLSRVFAADE